MKKNKEYRRQFSFYAKNRDFERLDKLKDKFDVEPLKKKIL